MRVHNDTRIKQGAPVREALVHREVNLRSVQELHSEAAEALGLVASSEYGDVCALLDECERTLSGVSMLGELSPRTRDRVVAYGERCSA